MWRLIKKYLDLYCMGIKNTKIFRLDFYLGVLSVPIDLVISYLFWKAILNGNQSIELKDLISYFLYLQIFQLCFSSAMLVTYELWNEINDGTIIVWLNKPLYYPVYILAQKLGVFTVNIVTSLILLLIIVLITRVSISAAYLTLGFLSGFLGYVLLFEIQFMIGCMTFWLKKVIVLRDVIMSILFLIGGIMLPINLTPVIIQKISYLTPIPFIYFIPAQICSGQYDIEGAIRGIEIQLFWIALLAASIFIAWNAGTKDKITQGA